MKTILITGAKGMFGQDAAKIFSENGYNVIPTDYIDFDITDNESVEKFFENKNVDIVLHGAAYTNVDKAEEEPQKAMLINGLGSENLARVTAQLGIPIVYISTDYVFDGTKKSAYLTSDTVKPLNVYGLSKLAGEDAVRRFNDNHYICRTSWLYGINGKNFVETMISLAKSQSELKVVDDQIGCPTWSYSLANGILKILKENKPFGTYHVCGSGCTSWYGFAKKIFELENMKINVTPCNTNEFPRPAKRPHCSIMENENICEDWQISLEKYLKQRKEGV